MTNGNDAPKGLNEALARIVDQIAGAWTNEEYNDRPQWQQFGLLWLGALTFTGPLFTLHFGQVVTKQFSGSGTEEVWLFLSGIVICAAAAALPAWLAMTKRKGQTKVRLFLTGFLLPYIVVGLLLPFLQTSGGGP